MSTLALKVQVDEVAQLLLAHLGLRRGSREPTRCGERYLDGTRAQGARDVFPAQQPHRSSPIPPELEARSRP